jgi:hypothetical protein
VTAPLVAVQGDKLEQTQVSPPLAPLIVLLLEGLPVPPAPTAMVTGVRREYRDVGDGRIRAAAFDRAAAAADERPPPWQAKL